MITEILKFSADWCSPCKKLEEELKNFDTIPIFNINIEEDKDNMASKYHIRSIPTLIYLDNNKNEVHRTIGFINIKSINDIINKFK